MTSSNGPPFVVSIATSLTRPPPPDSMATVWQNGRATRGREDQPMADSELARLQRRYRALTEQIRDLGFIATGSVIERYTVCAAAGCRCHADPPQRHGPYFQHTRKVAGKTVTGRLTPEDVGSDIDAEKCGTSGTGCPP